MLDMQSDAWHTLYILTFFVMGVAVIARASSYPSSSFRNRLLALGAFGLLHTVASWVGSVFDLPDGPPFYLEDAVYIPRSLALYYFAFGWDERHPLRAHGVVLASMAGCIAVSLFATEPGFMDIFTRYGLGIPASVCAAVIFARDKSFRFGSRPADVTRWAVSAGFIAYAFFQMFSDSGVLFPSSLINDDVFTAVTGVSARLPRGIAITVIGIGTLFLLNRFDSVMRKQTEAAFATMDAKLSRILQVAPEAIIIADRDGRIVLFNEGAHEIFGYSAEEAVGQRVEMLMPERFRSVHHGYADEFGASGDNSRKMGDRDEIAGRRKNGEEFPARATISKLDTPEGVIYTLVLRDITQSRAVRQELIAAKAAAEAANAAKSSFIANMSHELRTPLNAILGFSEIMCSEVYGPLGAPRYREYADGIHKSGQHLLEIVNDVLSISELEAKGTEKLGNRTAVDVHAVIGDCVKWTEQRASQTGVELRVDIPRDILALSGDKRLLTQVFLNLLTNAVKFTPAGGSVEVAAAETGEGKVRISVRDTGIGMSADQIARIGEPFLQFEQTMSRKFSGTGLGLLIVKRLVEAHGGLLTVDGTPGVGSTFTVELKSASPVGQTAPEARVA